MERLNDVVLISMSAVKQPTRALTLQSPDVDLGLRKVGTIGTKASNLCKQSHLVLKVSTSASVKKIYFDWPIPCVSQSQWCSESIPSKSVSPKAKIVLACPDSCSVGHHCKCWKQFKILVKVQQSSWCVLGVIGWNPIFQIFFHMIFDFDFDFDFSIFIICSFLSLS